jgi:basic membrane protein A and related proteins
MRSWRAKMLVLIGVLSLVAAACGDDDGGETGGAGGTATGSTGGAECNADMNVGVAYDVGGLGDKSFNDAANRGLQQAIADGLVCEDNAIVNEANSTGSDRDQNVQALADAGMNLVVGVGFAFSEGINTIAPDYPDVNFMIVDGFATCGTACGFPNDADAIPNVADYTFKEQEGSFLVGAAAVLKCECKTIGFLGGQTGPLIEKFQAGYEAGAHQIDPEVEVLVEYIGDDTTAFVNAPAGEELSTKMYDEGAEIIYHAAGASGAGLFNAAVEAQKLAIGVDSDQYLTASPEQQPLILTSMLKRVDVAVYNAIRSVGESGDLGGSQVFGMAEDGVDYATSNPTELTADITEQLDEFKQQIIDGTIVVPEEPEGA